MNHELPNISYCDGCSTEIKWGVWRNSGKRMPAHRDEAGRLVLVDGFWQYAEHDSAEKRYTSHFVTCPKAATFRNRSAR